MSMNNFIYLRRLHGRVHEAIFRQKMKKTYKERFVRPFLQKNKNGKKCVFLVLTPEHTNLGDHAIAKAEIELLENNNIEHVEITGKQLEEMQNKRLLNLLNKHPIIINGGGNLGTLWFEVEQLMRDIISANPKSPIFIFPNTFYYEDSEWGKSELQRSVKLYNSHKKLHIYAREQFSFEKMLPLYRDVKLVPDMVLSQNECVENESREGCLLCLRNDCEKTISEQEKAVLFEELTEIFGENIRYTDTHSPQNVLPQDRNEALELKYQEFRNAKLVITDRLHGMIFAAITGTPCIVINSKSPKVLGCYNWIKELEYIKFCDDVKTVRELYNSIPKEKYCYNNLKFKDLYHRLEEDLQKHIQ